jgi:histidine triad (HIT) family protein
MSDASCIFCKIAKKEIPAKIVFEDKDFVAFEDIRPQAPVHILVIPEYHIERVSDLKEENIDLIGKMVLAAGKLAKDRGVQESGYRIVLNCNADAGQEVFHLHLHLLGGRRFAWPPG